MRCCWLAWLLVVGLAGPAVAGDPARSQALKVHADRAFGEGDYLKALKLLEAAYKADPNPALRANMGLVYKELGENAAAVQAFRAFLKSDPPAPKAAMAKKLIAELEPTVSIASRPSGAAVFVDGAKKPAGKTPLQIPMVAGAHSVELRLPGHSPKTRRLRVRQGQALSVDLKLAPGYGGGRPTAGRAGQPAPPPMVVTHPVNPSGGGGGGGVAGWSLIGLGVVAAGGAAAAQVLGRQAADDRDAAQTGAAWDEGHDSVGTWNLVFWSSAGVAAAALTTGAILLATGSDEPAPVQVGLSPGGATLIGRF